MKTKKCLKERVKSALTSLLIIALVAFILCGMFYIKASATCNHLWQNGTCSNCGLVCQECDRYTEQYWYDIIPCDNVHKRYYECGNCGDTWSETIETCVFGTDGKCNFCRSTEKDDNTSKHNYVNSKCIYCGKSCDHSNIDMHYIQETNVHIFQPFCADCDIGVLIAHPQTALWEAHTFSNGACVKCSYSCVHSADSNYTFEPISTSTSYHSVRAWCTICGQRNANDSRNGAHETCTFKDSVCTYCGRTCSHSYVTDYISRDGDYNTHQVSKYCRICKTTTTTTEKHTYNMQNICMQCGIECTHPKFDSNYKCTYCAYQCTHSYSNGACTVCGKACPHNSFTYVSSEEGEEPRDNEHLNIEVCNHCGVTKKTAVPHNYYNYSCQDCGHVCQHSHYKDSFCVHCNYICPHTFVGSTCSICEYVCPHNMFNYSYSYEEGHDEAHIVKKTCQLCSVVETLTEAHGFDEYSSCDLCSYRCTHKYFDDGICRYCSWVCTHNYKNSVCQICNNVCTHYTYNVKYTGSDKNNQRFYCTTCDFETIDYELPMTFSNYFSYAPYPSTWNVKHQVLVEDKTEIKKVNRYFERYTIDKFDESHGYNGSVHLIGGSSIKDSLVIDKPITAGRYLVVRVRMSGIKHLQIYAFGGDSQITTFEDVVSECSSIHVYDIENLPQNEWCNLVIDLSRFNDIPGTTYKVGADIESMFLTLCFTYETDKSFVDIEYFGLCEEFSDIDGVSNYFGYNPISHYFYYATDEHSVLRYIIHDFNNSGYCDTCEYQCTHTEKYSVDVSTNTDCGVETYCSLCDCLTASTLSPHLFPDNTDTCSKCAFVCQHAYSGGSCVYCKWECIHKHVDGSIKCSVCGYYLDYDGYNDPDGFFKLFTAIYDAQANTFFSLLGYEILGVNIAGLIISIVALAIVAWILKKVL